MSFSYAKIDPEIIEHANYLDEYEHSHDRQSGKAKRREFCEKVTFLRWPITFFLLLAVFACEIGILRKQPSALPIGAELNGLVPHFSQERRIFRADSRYASDHKAEASINATKQHWLDLMPRGEGFLNVPDYESYILPPPMHYKETPGLEVFSIAMYHELHCLMHISFFVDKLTVKIRNRDFTLDEGELGHNDHCFNYLRNALLCCGDTTLEGQSQAPMFANVAGTDGTGAVHICRNSDEIYSWAERRRNTDGKETV